jgi:hypothetical protein
MYQLTLVVAPKENVTAAGVLPHLPAGADLCAQLTELLAKATERHQLLGWRVTEVTTG